MNPRLPRWLSRKVREFKHYIRKARKQGDTHRAALLRKKLRMLI